MITRIIIFLIMNIRPLLGKADCLFEETCTRYAVRMLHTQPFYKAIFLILHRLVHCSPLKYLLL